jgi:hypothetical protein
VIKHHSLSAPPARKLFLLRQLRLLYSQVYDWLQLYGLERVELRKQQASQWSDYDEEKYNEYKTIIHTLIPPEEISPAAIDALANHVVCGVLEMNFTEKIGDVYLGHWGRNLQVIYREIMELSKSEALQNVILAKQPVTSVTNGNYEKTATRIYGAFLHENERHLGGRVALADTNWEIHALNPDAETFFFRSPAAVHFIELQEMGNLFELAKNGSLSLQSINVI